jgi:threonyl-tRNA synthetase
MVWSGRSASEGSGSLLEPDLNALRHSAAHVLAAALCRLFKGIQLDIGPATDTGFYYDVDFSRKLTPEDFPAIEAEMARIVEADYPFERIEVTREEAERLLRSIGQTRYKLERLADIPEGEPITLYRCGDFLDLCRGPHLPSTGGVRAFKLTSVAGSYYRGDERNVMLQRIYGVARESREALESWLHQLEEAQRRDHRKLGRELDLFSVQEAVGPGLIHWHPKGARIRAVIEAFWREAHFRGGYDLLYTPHIGQAGLWQTSGHLDFYRENMYAPMSIDETAYYVKPMNCPFHVQVYKSRKRSYRDLPLRWAELGTVYRYEDSGVLHGLLRVRGFTQDDAHIFCTPDQIEAEVARTVRFALEIWKTFGFSDVTAYLSTRPTKAVGDPARWEQATASLESALQHEGLAYRRDEGGGAFYGPKIDLKVRDAIGREWQTTTVQFDFNLPERFDLVFTGADGQDHRPYMVHRALLGSLERFFGILIEHYAGAFPLWLAPEQVRVLPVSEKQDAAARALEQRLQEAGFRVGVDLSPGKIGARIREAQLEKIPYMAVVGAREAEQGTVAVRCRTRGDLGPMPIASFLAMLREEAERRSAMPRVERC